MHRRAVALKDGAVFVAMLLPWLGQVLYTRALQPGPMQRSAIEPWVLANLQKLSVLSVLSSLTFASGLSMALFFLKGISRRVAVIWNIALLASEILMSDFGVVCWSHGMFNFAALLVCMGFFMLFSSSTALLYYIKPARCTLLLMVCIIAGIVSTRVAIGYSRWPRGLFGHTLSNNGDISCDIRQPFVDAEYLVSPLKWILHGSWALRPCKQSNSVVHYNKDRMQFVLDCLAGEEPRHIEFLPFTSEPTDDLYRFVTRNIQVLEPSELTLNASGWITNSSAIVAQCGKRKSLLLLPITPNSSLVQRSSQKSRSFLEGDTANPMLARAGFQPDIVFIYVDAVSRAAFFRLLPRTTTLLNTLNNATSSTLLNQFLRVNSHNFNTPANSRAFLQGIPEPTTPNPEFLWEQLARAGYISFISDNTCAEWARKYGGRSSPPDVSPNAIWCLREYTGTREDNYALFSGGSAITTRCLLGMQADALVFQSAAMFAKAYAMMPKFMLLKFSEGHEFTSSVVSTIDANLASFIAMLDLNRTVLALVSDHGIHFGIAFMLRLPSVRLENRLPFAFIATPRWMLRNEQIAIVQHNEQALVVPADIHATLVSLVFHNSKPVSAGQSLFDVALPYNRTCAEAAIPPHICTCSKSIHT